MKIAIFRKKKAGFEFIVSQDDVVPDGIYAREYTRVTEWAEVEFKPIAEEQTEPAS